MLVAVAACVAVAIDMRVGRTAAAAGPGEVLYTGNAVSEYYFDPTGFFCTFGVTMTEIGVGASDDYYLEVGIMLDKSSHNPDYVQALDPSFQPLVINGTPILLEPAACTIAGTASHCKVVDAFPAPDTHRWIQFRSTVRIPATAGNSTLDFVVEAHWPNELTETVRTTDSAVWVSDNRDDDYGYLVSDYFEAGPFPYMIPECMGKDGTDVHVMFVNGSREAFHKADAGAPLSLSMVKPVAGGNGKFVVHLNAGVADPFSVTSVGFGLGNACFPFIMPPHGGAAPVSVWNNVGKESRLGASHYFGNPQASPARAPSFFHQQAGGDTANLPSGSEWSLQGIVVNPAASSARAASVTNVVEIEIQ